MNSSFRHEIISRRAHAIWEGAGRPDGSETEHWLQAERELPAPRDKAGEPAGDRFNPPMPALVGKHVPEKVRHSTDNVHPGVSADSLHHRRNR
jgi:hypothetical protein